MYQIIILRTETIKESKNVISAAKTGYANNRDQFSVRFFMRSRKLLLRVYSFTLPGLPILVRRSLFMALCLFFVNSKCIVVQQCCKTKSKLLVFVAFSSTQPPQEMHSEYTY